MLHIPGLTHLDCSFNDLAALPDHMDSMSSLATLSVKGNRITSLPPALGNMASLEYLDISCNKISSLPPLSGEVEGTKKSLIAAYNDLSVEEEARLEALAAGI